MGTLTQELLRIDRDAHATYQNALAKRDELLRAAREEALHLVQEAEHTRTQAREKAIREKEAALAKQKETMLADAKLLAEQTKARARLAHPETIGTILRALSEELER